MSEQIKYMSIEEQIEHLKEKGLLIHSKTLAKRYLNDIGYYKLINGYRKPFIVSQGQEKTKTQKYCENTSIDDLYYVYDFDKNLKALIFKYLSGLEVTIKSRMSAFKKIIGFIV